MRSLTAFVFAFLCVGPASASAGEVRICNESSYDLNLSFVWQQSIDVLLSNWRGSGPDSLPRQSCKSYFSIAQIYRIYLNAQYKGFFGSMNDVALAEKMSVRKVDGTVEPNQARFCLSKLGPNHSYNTGSLDSYADCPDKEKSLFSLWIVKHVGGSIDITLR